MIKEKKVTFAVIVVIFLVARMATGKIIYVDDDVAGANNGTSWAKAYKYLQDAITDASNSQKPVEIRVAQGIYRPDQGANRIAGDRTAAFQLINGVTLKGGYAGLSTPEPNARDINAYESILSGDLAGNDINVNDPCDLRNEPTLNDNSSRVVVGSGTDENAVLDGFTVTGGHCSIIVRNGSPVGGAGMLNKSGRPTLIDCTFSKNTVVFGDGGGILNYDGGSPKLIRCTFTKNYALLGAGISNWDNSNPSLLECRFTDNLAEQGGGMNNHNSNPTLTNCVFKRNLVPSISNVGLGGAIYYSNSNSVIRNCFFIENSAESSGGVLAIESCDLMFVNCIFSGNLAKQVAGGVINSQSIVHLVNCIFSGNSAGQGSAIYSFKGITSLTNCIVWHNEGSAVEGPATIIHSDIEGGWPGECIGNIDVDPLFADPGYWANPNDPNTTADPNDPNAIWVDGDYHLKSQAGRWDPATQAWVVDNVTSPCIDAGDPASPIGEEPFPNGGRINMGAYGGTAEASKSYFGKPPCETIIAGDINCDCKVDFLDFAILAYHWLEESINNIGFYE